MARGIIGVVDYDVVEGPVRSVRKINRKCGYCGHKLSDRNPNKYCWVHILKGWQKDMAVSEANQYASYRKHLKKMKELKARKKRALLKGKKK